MKLTIADVNVSQNQTPIQPQNWDLISDDLQKIQVDNMLKRTLALLLFCASMITFAADFVAGKDFEILPRNQPSEKGSQLISVTEFFSFGCPWCYRLESPLAAWVKQNQSTIDFKKTPVVFNKDWEYYAKAYYAAEALSLNSTLNPSLFKAILDDKQPLNTNKAMIHFFVKHGVDEAIATSAFTHSPSIELSVKEGVTAMAHDHINAVPAFVVNHQFKTDLQMAKTETRLFEILDFLLKKSKTQ